MKKCIFKDNDDQMFIGYQTLIDYVTRLKQPKAKWLLIQLDQSSCCPETDSSIKLTPDVSSVQFDFSEIRILSGTLHIHVDKSCVFTVSVLQVK